MACPAGATGQSRLAPWYSGALVLPQNGLWIVADNENDTRELDELAHRRRLEFHGYNTGSYDHTVYLTFA